MLKQSLFIGLLIFCCSSLFARQIKSFLRDGTENKVLICGHRGGFYQQYPENSITAFEYILKNAKPTVMVEFDIRESKDGTLFVMHDETIDRTTSGTGKVADLTDGYLKSLFLKTQQGELTHERIPTFDDVLQFAEGNSMLLMLDVKANVWERVVTRLEEKKLLHRSIILTFTLNDSRRVSQASNQANISCLVNEEGDWRAIQALNIPANRLYAYVGNAVSEKLIDNLRDRGIPLLSDASEIKNNHGVLYADSHYQNMIVRKKLNILVTDFPIEVSKISP
jgi:glycerophosphoryl diester phosphodiesterase